jgi:tetratricopeptide (TPR) repeat protein
MLGVAVVWACVWLSVACEPVRLQAAPEDWQACLRQLVEQQALANALALAEDRLSEHPEDLEARGWRARLLAWTNRWNESEIEYRAVLESAPYDMDILVGLADLLSWQERRTEAIVFLNQASILDAGRKDVQLRRGRLLHALGLRAEAGAAYAQLLSLKGLFVGMEDELAQPATAFLHRRSEGRLNPFSGGADLLEFGLQQRFRSGPSIEMRNGKHARAGVASRTADITDRRFDLEELRLGGNLQSNNGMNYAVRF